MTDQPETTRLYYIGPMDKSFGVKVNQVKVGKIRPGVRGAHFLTINKNEAAWLEANQPGLWSRVDPMPPEKAAPVQAAETAPAPRKAAPKDE